MTPDQLPLNMQKKIRVSESGCWEWFGAIQSQGYGAVGVNGRSQSTHRMAYELLVGPIPGGLVIDHLCRNRKCCNPEHLEVVTRLVNNQRGAPATKTRCTHGHPLYGDNLIIKKSRGRKMRNCRACANAAYRAWYQRNKSVTEASVSALQVEMRSAS